MFGIHLTKRFVPTQLALAIGLTFIVASAAGCKQGVGNRCQLLTDCVNACAIGESPSGPGGCLICANPVTGSTQCGQGVAGDCMCTDEMPVPGTDAGPGTDAAPGTDSGTDSGSDSGSDSGASDSGPSDSGPGTDALPSDSGPSDSGPPVDSGLDSGM